MCIYCDRRNKVWEGSDPICGFNIDGSFNKENWNCALLNNLRELAEKRNDIFHAIGDNLFLFNVDEISEDLSYIDFNELDKNNILLSEVDDINNYINYDDKHTFMNAIIILKCYKSRGRVDSAYVIYNDEIYPFNRQLAERILYEHNFYGHMED